MSLKLVMRCFVGVITLLVLSTLVAVIVVAYGVHVERGVPDAIIEMQNTAGDDIPTHCNAPELGLKATEFRVSSAVATERGKIWQFAVRLNGFISSRINPRLDRYHHYRLIAWLQRKVVEWRLWAEQWMAPDPKKLTLRINFSLSNPATIEEVSIELPESFIDSNTFELFCTLPGRGDGQIAFRRLGRRIHTLILTEEPVYLIPRRCLGQDNVVDLAISSSDAPITARASAEEFIQALKPVIGRAFYADHAKRVAYLANIGLYLPKVSYRTGETLEFHVHSFGGSHNTLEIYKAGLSSKLLVKETNLPGMNQLYSPLAFRYGANWPATYRFTIPADWTSGYYVAIVSNEFGRASFPFVVAPPRGDQTAVALVASTNTWQAYNSWGEGSFYFYTYGDCTNIRYSRMISKERPTIIGTTDVLGAPTQDAHLFTMEHEIAKWLEGQGIQYVVYTDDNLHEEPGVLNTHRVTVLTSHPEYYSDEMVANVDGYLKQGGNLLYLGGNAIAIRITRTATQMEKQEAGGLHDMDGRFGGYLVGLGRSQARLLGVEYDGRGWNTYFPYAVIAENHPIFAGTGLRKGDEFGVTASGHETDKISSSTPANAIHLAKGTNPNEAGADMVIYDHPAGGLVFSAGSISFAQDLENPTLSRIVRNAFDLALARKEAATHSLQ